MPASPELIRRVDALDGCEGSWYLDRRDEQQRGYDIDHLPTFGCRTPAEALAACAEEHWRNMRLLFSPAKIDDDCAWPGGYDAPSYYRSNARIFRQEFAAELELADGDGPGIALDVRYITQEMIDTIHALEDYPIIDESDHSELELDLQQEAWECWAADDWRNLVTNELQEHAPETASDYWAEEILETVPGIEDKLQELFEACREQANEYWAEESDGGMWIRVSDVAAELDLDDLAELTGLPLLSPQQEWRREPYPWPGAEPAPLAPSIS